MLCCGNFSCSTFKSSCWPNQAYSTYEIVAVVRLRSAFFLRLPSVNGRDHRLHASPSHPCLLRTMPARCPNEATEIKNYMLDLHLLRASVYYEAKSFSSLVHYCRQHATALLAAGHSALLALLGGRSELESRLNDVASKELNC